MVEDGEGAGPPRIVLAGENGRGAVYAAYDLLERAGCRWFYPAQDPEDPEVVPRRPTIDLDPCRRSVASPLRFRIANGSAWFFQVDPRAAALQLDWAMKCRYNAVGWQGDHRSPIAGQYRAMEEAGLIAELEKRDMVLHGPAHSFDQFLRAEDHLKDHPEWFGLRDGKRVPQTYLGAQFCWSNPGARAEFVRNVEAFVRACPRLGILAIVPFDGGKACACGDCRRAGPANLLVKLLGEVIARLAETAPGVLVETVGGYEPMTEPPSGAAIDPRLRIVWAHWGRYLKTGYDDPAYGRRGNLEAWRKAAPGGLTVCQYYADNFSEPWILPPFTAALAGDRRYFLSRGIESVYVLFWPKGFWWNHSLNGFLAGRCFYDVSLDPESELRDHALRYYGERAGGLLASWFEEWARDVDLAYRVRDGATEEDRAELAAERRRWIDPAAAAAAGDPVLARRVGKVEKLHDLAERLAGLHLLRQETRAAAKSGDRAAARRLLAQARERTEETLTRMRALADLEQGLIDRNEVAGESPSPSTPGSRRSRRPSARSVPDRSAGIECPGRGAGPRRARKCRRPSART